MSKFRNTLKSKYYWTTKGQGRIYGMLHDQIKKRGDSAKLAKKIGSTPGYVSQILSGDAEINPTWKKIVKFCLALDKVPVLEIKALDEYLYEEKLKASYRKYYHIFPQSCETTESDENDELKSEKTTVLNDYAFTIQVSMKQKSNSQFIEYKYDEYELV
ncbi:helix-turn-helix domain-containing protein [Membranihabitans marinus]|uniref:helix-turn-helix domain-containing protein n=1 Tax=Membranihabitans marinus TaxID=1227546 RepID=UPI001F2C42B0|nr:helix-turn-helix transcriptional regulator [Membranihabitans marinus]